MNELVGYSLAGRDKGKIYLILKEEKNYYWVCDGNRYSRDNLKRKNKKHMQLVKKYNIRELISASDDTELTDVMMKEICMQISKDIQEVK